MERWDSPSFGKLAKPSNVIEAALMWLRGWRKMYYGVWWRKPEQYSESTHSEKP